MQLILLAFVAACVLTALVRKLVLRFKIVDTPGVRSSHSIPTARGGGLAIVIVVSVMAACLSPPVEIIWIISVAAALGVLGLIDDYRDVSPKLRLLCQVGAAMAVLWACWPLALSVFGLPIPAPLLLLLLLLWFVWCTNLYNFMDGINGLAGGEAATVALNLFIVLMVGAEQSAVPALCLVVAGAALGFLLWNFPRARIFMGDVGSVYLGALFAGLSVYFLTIQAELFWSLVILLAVFVADATVTLMHRALLRLPVSQPHRTHAYQYASRRFGSHTKVTIAALMINICWLLPLALLVALQRIGPELGLLVAYLPLVLLVIYLGAGKPEVNNTSGSDS